MALKWRPGMLDRYDQTEQTKRDRYGFPGYKPGLSPRPSFPKTHVQELNLDLTGRENHGTTEA